MPKINSSSVKICESSRPRLAQKFSIVTRTVVVRWRLDARWGAPVKVFVKGLRAMVVFLWCTPTDSTKVVFLMTYIMVKYDTYLGALRTAHYQERGGNLGFSWIPELPTSIAFWPGEKELNLHIKHITLEPNYNQLFLNLGRVSHDVDSINSYCRKCNQRSARFLSTRKL